MDPRGEIRAPIGPGSEVVSSAQSNASSAQTGNAAADLPPIPEGVDCPDCSYDLRGLTGTHCPECGFDLEIVRTQTPQIPWARRRKIGRVKAYWQTVWLVCRHPRRLHMEMVRPVSYRDSQSFRWSTFLHAFLPLPVCLGLLIASESACRGQDFILVAVGVLIGTGLWLAMSPGAASYTLESRRLSVAQRNCGIALSYYAWAPLAALVAAPPLLGVACGMSAIWGRTDNSVVFGIGVTFLVAAAITAILAIFLATHRQERLCRRVLRGCGRAWLRIAWTQSFVGVAVMLLSVAIPLSIFYLIIIWRSLH